MTLPIPRKHRHPELQRIPWTVDPHHLALDANDAALRGRDPVERSDELGRSEPIIKPYTPRISSSEFEVGRVSSDAGGELFGAEDDLSGVTRGSKPERSAT